MALKPLVVEGDITFPKFGIGVPWEMLLAAVMLFIRHSILIGVGTALPWLFALARDSSVGKNCICWLGIISATFEAVKLLAVLYPKIVDGVAIVAVYGIGFATFLSNVATDEMFF